MLPAEETPTKKEWFQGTADAVRQNLQYFIETPADYFLILSGDQLYRLNFQNMLRTALETGVDLTIASIATSQDNATRMGVLKVNKDRYITDFAEKPKEAALLKKLISSQKNFKSLSIDFDASNPYLASMGIYLFKRQALLISSLTTPGKTLENTLSPLWYPREIRQPISFKDIGKTSEPWNPSIRPIWP